ncbi:hypothetical protein E2C01_016228 [Portunus trituberculatus]|uniref:Uncharacterized protein n=1 Tax=Portunus trituberculatus TaxID=210409 RepID=A0A5B7DP01_PORTR|nr:hypothetical protein [Portunus trituberculatus]
MRKPERGGADAGQEWEPCVSKTGGIIAITVFAEAAGDVNTTRKIRSIALKTSTPLNEKCSSRRGGRRHSPGKAAPLLTPSASPVPVCPVASSPLLVAQQNWSTADSGGISRRNGTSARPQLAVMHHPRRRGGEAVGRVTAGGPGCRGHRRPRAGHTPWKLRASLACLLTAESKVSPAVGTPRPVTPPGAAPRGTNRWTARLRPQPDNNYSLFWLAARQYRSAGLRGAGIWSRP